MREARSWSDTPPCDGGQDKAAVFAPRGKGALPVIGGTDVRLPGKLAEGHAPHHLFDKNDL